MKTNALNEDQCTWRHFMVCLLFNYFTTVVTDDLQEFIHIHVLHTEPWFTSEIMWMALISKTGGVPCEFQGSVKCIFSLNLQFMMHSHNQNTLKLHDTYTDKGKYLPVYRIRRKVTWCIFSIFIILHGLSVRRQHRAAAQLQLYKYKYVREHEDL